MSTVTNPEPATNEQTGNREGKESSLTEARSNISNTLRRILHGIEARARDYQQREFHRHDEFHLALSRGDKMELVPIDKDDACIFSCIRYTNLLEMPWFIPVFTHLGFGVFTLEERAHGYLDSRRFTWLIEKLIDDNCDDPEDTIDDLDDFDDMPLRKLIYELARAVDADLTKAIKHLQTSSPWRAVSSDSVLARCLEDAHSFLPPIKEKVWSDMDRWFDLIKRS